MNCLVSTDRTQLDAIVSQINALCGWPNGHTTTATVVEWSDKAQTFWCCIEDERILSVISQVNLGALTIQQHPVDYFINYIPIA